LGFPPCDVELFQTFFKVTATLGVSFTYTLQENEADILLVDACDAAAVDRVSDPAFGVKALVVGDLPPGSHWPVLPRPFRLIDVLQILQGFAADIAAPGQCHPAEKRLQRARSFSTLNQR